MFFLLLNTVQIHKGSQEGRGRQEKVYITYAPRTQRRPQQQRSNNTGIRIKSRNRNEFNARSAGFIVYIYVCAFFFHAQLLIMIFVIFHT